MRTELDRLETVLDRLTSDLPDSKVKAALRYALLGNGKRLRPLLVLSLIKEPLEADLEVACALEMVHTYSLIHDDLPAMDNDDLRRGKPTVHRAFDEATAILAGDALLNLAFETLAHTDLDPQTKVECLKVLGTNAGAKGMVLGQDQDMFPNSFTIESIETMYRNKTGRLLGCALALGAILSHRLDIKETLQKIGEELGILFQIQDDLLEIDGDPLVIGKSINSDQQNDKKTYVALCGVDRSKSEVKRRYEAIRLEVLDKVENPDKVLSLFDQIIKRSH